MGFATGSIEQAIKDDNIELFCELITDPSFDVNNGINFNSDTHSKSYMRLIALYGAVNGFRQAIMNETFDLKDISEYAIIEQEGIYFDNCLEIGVKYHRMDKCDWLLMHTKCESIDLSSSLEYFNFPAFFFTVINDMSFNEALIIASNKGKIEVIKYLIEQCNANVEEKEI
jgi:hypothetical protein